MDKTIFSNMGLLDLPCETLIQIFEYLSFEEVANSRIICKRIDDVCQKILNRGFKRAAHQSAISYKRIKLLLPRRESERRNHSLVRHADILSSVETRLSMLSMTYTKYIDLNMCCFIPGRVLDEIFHILRLTKQRSVPLRPLEILQEFRDISSMAIEHFDEHIASEFKRTLERNTLCKVVVHSGDSSPETMHSAESLCSSNELLWVRKYARSSYVTPLTPLGGKMPNETAPPVDVKCNKNATTQRLAYSKEFRIKRLEKTIAGLEKTLIKQKKNYKREVYRLNRNFSMTKRRLDEMDSKYKELIETVRQYNLEPQPQNGQANNNLNATPATATETTDDDTITATSQIEDAAVLHVNPQDTLLEPQHDNAIYNDNDDHKDTAPAAVAQVSCANSDQTRIKRPWLMSSEDAEMSEIPKKNARHECAD